MVTNSHGHLETGRADKAVWLMKGPALVSRSFKNPEGPSRPVAKVILSIDPLGSNDDEEGKEEQPPQFIMELLGSESGNAPNLYSMDMSKQFVPMSVFSESIQGKLTVEGKMHRKFDMRPHEENIENYSKLCRERTTKSMTNSRQTQVIDNDSGSHVRPMPGMMIIHMISVLSSFVYIFFSENFIYVFLVVGLGAFFVLSVIVETQKLVYDIDYPPFIRGKLIRLL